MSFNKGWIGVDLDGTLAHYDHWRGVDHVGDPIPSMVARIRQWEAEGFEVRIFTARASIIEYIPFVKSWLMDIDLGHLTVTCQKDFEMVALWDDRCVQIMPNTGEPAVAQEEWTYVNCNEDGSLINLPPDNAQIFLQSGQEFYAGSFTSDEQEYGFYPNVLFADPQFIDAEQITKWKLAPAIDEDGAQMMRPDETPK